MAAEEPLLPVPEEWKAANPFPGREQSYIDTDFLRIHRRGIRKLIENMKDPDEKMVASRIKSRKIVRTDELGFIVTNEYVEMLSGVFLRGAETFGGNKAEYKNAIDKYRNNGMTSVYIDTGIYETFVDPDVINEILYYAVYKHSLYRDKKERLAPERANQAGAAAAPVFIDDREFSPFPEFPPPLDPITVLLQNLKHAVIDLDTAGNYGLVFDIRSRIASIMQELPAESLANTYEKDLAIDIIERFGNMDRETDIVSRDAIIEILTGLLNAVPNYNDMDLLPDWDARFLEASAEIQPTIKALHLAACSQNRRSTDP